MSFIKTLLRWLRLKLRPDEKPDLADLGLGYKHKNDGESLMPGGTGSGLSNTDSYRDRGGL